MCWLSPLDFSGGLHEFPIGPKHQIFPKQRHPRPRPSGSGPWHSNTAWLQQRQEKQQQVAGGHSDSSDKVSVTASYGETRDTERTELEANFNANMRFVGELCDYTTETRQGLNLYKRQNQKGAQVTLGKERTNFSNADLSLPLTPPKEIRK